MCARCTIAYIQASHHYYYDHQSATHPHKHIGATNTHTHTNLYREREQLEIERACQTTSDEVRYNINISILYAYIYWCCCWFEVYVGLSVGVCEVRAERSTAQLLKWKYYYKMVVLFFLVGPIHMDRGLPQLAGRARLSSLLLQCIDNIFRFNIYKYYMNILVHMYITIVETCTEHHIFHNIYYNMEYCSRYQL